MNVLAFLKLNSKKDDKGITSCAVICSVRVGRQCFTKDRGDTMLIVDLGVTQLSESPASLDLCEVQYWSAYAD